MREQVEAAIRRERLVAILRGVPAEHMSAMGESLLAGGIPLMEVALSTADALDGLARLVETAILVHAMQGWLRQLRLKEEFCTHFAIPDDAVASGLVEAARGALGHWVSIKGGEINRYQIIAPTTWNFSPRDAAGVAGPLEQALVGLDTGERGAQSAALQHVIRSYDPCMVCTAH